MSPPDYTARYDAVAAAIHTVSPDTKFVALALAAPSQHPEMFEYFLDHKNHRPGIPLDMISYHFYATPAAAETAEIGNTPSSTRPTDSSTRSATSSRSASGCRPKRAPPWTKSAASCPAIPRARRPFPMSTGTPRERSMRTCIWQAMRMGIDIVGESQFVGYPTQFPSVSMVDWNTGIPNARFRVLQLIHDHFAPGDKLVETQGATWRRSGAGVRHTQGPRSVVGEQAQRGQDGPAQGGMEGCAGNGSRFRRRAAYRGVRRVVDGTGAFCGRGSLREVARASARKPSGQDKLTIN